MRLYSFHNMTSILKLLFTGAAHVRQSGTVKPNYPSTERQLSQPITTLHAL